MDTTAVCTELYTIIFGKESEKEIKELAKVSSLRILSKKEFLYRIGDLAAHQYFLYEGVVRSFCFKPNGSEMTETLATQKGTPLVLQSNMRKPDALGLNYQAIAPSILVSVTFIDFFNVCSKNPQMMKRYLRLLGQQILRHDEEIKMRSQRDVDRCLWFRKEYGEWENLLQKQHIASFLDLTLPSYIRALSRINT